MRTIVIDPGHSGPVDPGAVNHELDLHEADVVLTAARMLAARLTNDKYITLLTRNGDIDNDDLTWRAEIATANNADLLVSIHCNAAENPDAEGFEVWTAPGESLSDQAATKIFYAISRAFPDMEGRADMGDDDPDKEARFTVLTATDVPAVLVEMAFISNPDEAAKLADESFLSKMTDAIAAGIVNYFGEL